MLKSPTKRDLSGHHKDNDNQLSHQQEDEAPSVIGGANNTQLSASTTSFPYKLYNLLSKNHENIITWLDSGEMFRVYDRRRLENEVLPLYFNHKKFASFQKQLSIYGFSYHTQTLIDLGGYSHQYFKRGREDLLPLIERLPQKCDAAKSRKYAATRREKKKRRIDGEHDNGDDNDVIDGDDDYRSSASSSITAMSNTIQGNRSRNEYMMYNTNPTNDSHCDQSLFQFDREMSAQVYPTTYSNHMYNSSSTHPHYQTSATHLSTPNTSTNSNINPLSQLQLQHHISYHHSDPPFHYYDSSIYPQSNPYHDQQQPQQQQQQKQQYSSFNPSPCPSSRIDENRPYTTYMSHTSHHHPSSSYLYSDRISPPPPPPPPSYDHRDSYTSLQPYHKTDTCTSYPYSQSTHLPTSISMIYPTHRKDSYTSISSATTTHPKDTYRYYSSHTQNFSHPHPYPYPYPITSTSTTTTTAPPLSSQPLYWNPSDRDIYPEYDHKTSFSDSLSNDVYKQDLSYIPTQTNISNSLHNNQSTNIHMYSSQRPGMIGNQTHNDTPVHVHMPVPVVSARENEKNEKNEYDIEKSIAPLYQYEKYIPSQHLSVSTQLLNLKYTSDPSKLMNTTNTNTNTLNMNNTITSTSHFDKKKDLLLHPGSYDYVSRVHSTMYTMMHELHSKYPYLTISEWNHLTADVMTILLTSLDTSTCTTTSEVHRQAFPTSTSSSSTSSLYH